jgi:hypothetical protein
MQSKRASPEDLHRALTNATGKAATRQEVDLIKDHIAALEQHISVLEKHIATLQAADREALTQIRAALEKDGPLGGAETRGLVRAQALRISELEAEIARLKPSGRCYAPRHINCPCGWDPPQDCHYPTPESAGEKPSGRVADDERILRSGVEQLRSALGLHPHDKTPTLDLSEAITRISTKAQGYEAIRKALAENYGTDGDPLERVKDLLESEETACGEARIEQDERHRVEAERDTAVADNAALLRVAKSVESMTEDLAENGSGADAVWTSKGEAQELLAVIRANHPGAALLEEHRKEVEQARRDASEEAAQTVLIPVAAWEKLRDESAMGGDNQRAGAMSDRIRILEDAARHVRARAGIHPSGPAERTGPAGQPPEEARARNAGLEEAAARAELDAGRNRAAAKNHDSNSREASGYEDAADALEELAADLRSLKMGTPPEVTRYTAQARIGVGPEGQVRVRPVNIRPAGAGQLMETATCLPHVFEPSPSDGACQTWVQRKSPETGEATYVPCGQYLDQHFAPTGRSGSSG